MNIIKINAKNMIHVLSACGMIATLITMYLAYQQGLFTSAEKLKAFVDAIGIWGPVSFILLQVIQVVVPIIPGGITCVAGIIIFGPFWGFIYNYIGIVLGKPASLLLYSLGLTSMLDLILKFIPTT